MHFFVILWMMSCFLIPLPLCFCTPRLALLLLSVFLSTNRTRFYVFGLSSPCICVCLSLFSCDFQAGQQSILGIPVFLSFLLCFWLFYSNCLCWQFVFFELSVFLEFKIGRQVCWHIFPGRHWVSRFTSEPFTMKDRGIKTAAALQTTASLMWASPASAFLAQYIQIFLPFKHSIAAFYGPLLFPSSHRHSFNCFWPKHLIHASHLPTPQTNCPHPLSQYSSHM